MEAPAGGGSRPRTRWRAGAPIGLMLWTSLVVVDRVTSHALSTTWTVFALACCVCGLLVTFGRFLARRPDTWDAALVAALGSVAGPLSLLLLLLRPVRAALREIPLLVRGQELRQLGHERLLAEAAARRPASRATTAPVPVLAHSAGKRFVFGDLRRPRRLALVLIASILSFPVCWIVLLVIYGLGGSESRSLQHDERVILVLAVIPAAIGLLLAGVDRFRAGKSREGSAGTARSREGLLCGLAVLAVLGAAVGLFVKLWTSVV